MSIDLSKKKLKKIKQKILTFKNNFGIIYIEKLRKEVKKIIFYKKLKKSIDF